MLILSSCGWSDLLPGSASLVLALPGEQHLGILLGGHACDTVHWTCAKGAIAGGRKHQFCSSARAALDKRVCWIGLVGGSARRSYAPASTELAHAVVPEPKSWVPAYQAQRRRCGGCGECCSSRGL